MYVCICTSYIQVKAWIHVPSAGLDAWFTILENIGAKLAAGDMNGVKLTHSPGVHGTAMGEYVAAHVLSQAKRIPYHLDLQQQKVWGKVMQKGLSGATLGILGCGGIGLNAAKMLKPFGMKIIATKRSITAHIATADVASYVDAGLTDVEVAYIDDFYPPSDTLAVCEMSDYVVCCLPNTADTRELIDKEYLNKIGKEGTFINVSRGEVVNQEDLIEALNSGSLGGAVLDVTTPEPLPKGHPLWTAKNVVITPHDSWNSPVSMQNIVINFLANGTWDVSLSLSLSLSLLLMLLPSLLEVCSSMCMRVEYTMRMCLTRMDVIGDVFVWTRALPVRFYRFECSISIHSRRESCCTSD